MMLRKIVIRWALGVACSGALMGASGCGGKAATTSETHVGRAELYRTGNFNYDELFEDLNALQVGTKNVADDEKTARAMLGQALGVGETSMDRMLEVLKTKADEQAQSKSRVHFAFENIDDQGKPLAGRQITITTSAAKGRAVPKDAAELASAIEQSARAEGRVWEKYAPAPEKGHRLSAKAGSLRGSVDADFATYSKTKREEIVRELDAAKVVADEIAGRCETVVGTTSKFLKQGPEIVAAAAIAEVKPPAKGAKGKAGKLDKGEKSEKAERSAAKKDAPPKAAAASSPKPPPAEPKEAPSSPPPPKPAEGSGDFNP